MRMMFPVLVALVLSACGAQEKEQASNDAAVRSVMTSVISSDYSGVSVAPVVDCMFEHTTEEERLALLDAALAFGVTGGVAATVRRMEMRPSTQSCIAAKGVVKPRLGDF